MKKIKKGNTTVSLLVLIWFAWWILVFGCWAGNIYKITQCDFEAPYKGEIIHTIGLLPGVSLVTVWSDAK